MGKKRRFIHRARKFAKKYFKVLDGFDGNADDSEIEEYAAFIDTIVATDLNNQTVQLTGRVLGNVSAVADDGIEYSLDGGENFIAVDSAITDNNSGDIDEFTYNSGTGGSAIGIGAFAAALPIGKNTVIVRPKGITDPQRDKELSFDIRENKINLVLGEGTFSDDTEQNIDFDASAITLDATPGKIRAGSNTNAALGAASNIGIRITILKDGVAQAIQDKANGNVATTQTVGPGNFSTTALDITNILNAAVEAQTTFVCRVEPVDSEGNVLSASAVEQTVTVAGP